MPKTFTIGTYDKKHKENLAKRARKVQQLYDAAIKRIAQAAAPSLFDADPKKEFHFEDFPALKKEMEALMQDLGSSLQANIEDGDQESWTLSNTKNDAMVDSIIGKKHLPKKVVQAWKHPHLEALNAFIERKEAGMNLSRRVWNLTQQFKSEMELALELGMGEGKSAAALSRDIRKYLVEPNKLFRRVRDKSGALRLSKAAAAYHPGQGVYRSSYKNALRMTATENNIAYRTADHNRWQALPFVIGIEIHISNNHPTEDICDLFDGKRFPKDFKFTGWHPWCRCYAVSVLASQEEMDAYTTAIMNGEDVSHWKFTGQVEKMPKEFNKWMKDNQARIENATSMPYFIKDNFKDGDPAKGLRWEGKKKAKTTLEKAEERHAARTQEQIADIQKRAEERQKRHAMMKQTALDAQAAGKEMPEISTTALTKAINEGNLDKMFNLGQKVQKKVEKMKLAEANLEDIIPNVHEWHKKHTIKELEAAHSAVEGKLQHWSGVPNEKLKDKLDFEIAWIKNHPKYATDEVAVAAYQKKLNTVEFNIQATEKADILATLKAYKSKSQAYKNIIDIAEEKLAQLTEENQNAQMPIVEDWIKKAQLKQQQLEAAKAKTAAKKAAKKATPTPTGKNIMPGNTTKQEKEFDAVTFHKEAIDLVQQTLSCSKAEADKYFKAVNGFTFLWDYDIRHYQMGVKFTSKYKHTMAEIKQKAIDVEEFIKKSPKWDGGATYRGMAVDDKTMQAFRDAMKNNQQIDMLGTASWSTKRDISDKFAQKNKDPDKGLTNTILFKTTKAQYGTSIRHMSQFAHEHEILCSKDSRYIIKSIKEISHGDYEIIVEPTWKLK